MPRMPLTVILGMATAIGPFTIDLYLPALNALAEDLRATETAAQLTLVGTVLGLSIGQFAAGVISDITGRRTIFLTAVAVHVLSSVACVLAPTIELVIALRVVMGVSSAGAAVVSIAVVRDRSSGPGMLRIMGVLTSISGIAPLIAPVIGAQLLQLLDWRGIFLSLAGYGLIVLVLAAVALPETLPAPLRASVGPRELFRHAGALFRDRVFVGLCIVNAMNWAALFSHLAATPFVMEEIFGLRPTQYSLLFVLFAVAYVAGVQVGARVGRRVGVRAIVVTGLMLESAGALGTMALSGLGMLWPLVLTSSLVLAGISMCMPTITTSMLSAHGRSAGVTASMLGGISLAAAGIAMVVITAAGLVTPFGLGLAQTLLIVVAQAAFWLVAGPRMARG